MGFWKSALAMSLLSIILLAIAEQPKTVRRIVEMKSLGTYLTYLPPGYQISRKKYPLCIILHGRGSNEVHHGDNIAAWLGRKEIIYISIRAAYTQWTDGREHYSAFADNIPNASERKRTMRIYSQWIDDCAQDALKNFRCDPKKIHIIGYSQGAASAIAYAGWSGRLKSCFIYGVYDPWTLDANALNRMKKTKIVLAHSKGDPLININQAYDLEKKLTRAGVPVTAKYFDLNTHGFEQPVQFYAKKWANQSIRN